MRGWAVSLTVLVLVLGGCAATAPRDGSGATISPSVEVSEPVAASPSIVASAPDATSSSAAPPTFCPGRTWPPYRLGGIPGITATSSDRATIEITNRTSRTYYFWVSGWQLAQFETCRTLGEEGVGGGPLAAGATERVTLAGNFEQLVVRITIAFWDRPCGEACQREPIAAMVVVRSRIEPAAS